MDREEFLSTLKNTQPPKELGLALTALWWDAKGDWNKAHEHAQQESRSSGAWVHAYLHRKEGDISNADYWYSQAGRKRPQNASDVEWQEIVEALLKEK